MTGRRGHDDDYHPTRPEAVAEHPYWKIGWPLMGAAALGLFAWFANAWATDLRDAIKDGSTKQGEALEKINTNITNIALTGQGLATLKVKHNEDFKDLDDTHGDMWRVIGHKVDK